MQSLFRQLENFQNSQQATYKLFLSNSTADFYEPLLHVDLPPTLRLLSYLKALSLLSQPASFAMELCELQQNFVQENTRFRLLRASLYSRRFLRDIENQIALDINRLFTQEPFFAHAQTRKVVGNLTLLFASQRNFCIYKQGVHEIFAIAYLIAFNGCRQNFYSEALNTPELIHLAQFQPKFAPVYAYYIGCGLMSFLNPLYTDESDAVDIARRFGGQALDPRVLATMRDGAVKRLCEQLIAETPGDVDDFMAEFFANQKYSMPSLLSTAKAAVFAKLEQLDCGLFERLYNLHLESVFLLRWMRLAFLREVDLPCVSRLWDFMLYQVATTRTAVFLENFAVVLLLSQREQIHKFDYSVLMRQFSLPALQQFNLAQICAMATKAVNLHFQSVGEVQNLPEVQKVRQTDGLRLLAEFNKVAANELMFACKSKDFKLVREVATLLQAVQPESSREFQRGLRAQDQGLFITESEAFVVVCQDLLKRLGDNDVTLNEGSDGREVSE